MNKEVIIIKASGEKEAFSEEKLRNSLSRANVPSDAVDLVINKITKGLKDGVTTSEIYKKAFALVSKKYKPAASRYHLKKAIMELGPAGHLFEQFVGELLKAQGFSVEVSKIVQGACVSHEVDVWAKKNNHQAMVECKFHNRQGISSDVKTALYIQARFQDIVKNLPNNGNINEAWLVTNTKLTSDAVKYASCMKMKTIGWRHPSSEGLEQLIEKFKLYPVTSLLGLNRSQQHQLTNQGIILCRDVINNIDVLKLAGFSKAKIEKITKEAEELTK